MKRLVIFLTALFWTTSAWGDFLGIKKSSEYVSFFLNEPLDSSGVPVKPDSVHIITYADNAFTATFSTRSTTYPFSTVGIDTLKNYADTAYVFVDQIQDIDGAGGNFELAVEVRLFCDGLPTSTRHTVQVISDSLNTKLGRLDSLGYLDESISGIDDNPWDDATRSLTELDEDNTSIDLDGSTIGTVSNVSDKTGYALTTSEHGSIADTARELLLRTLLVPGYPTDGDTVSALLARISTITGYIDGSDGQGVDTWVENIYDNVDALLDYERPIPIRYIDDDGDNSDGLTIATAWTGFDNVSALTAPTKVHVLPGTYSSVACTVNTDGIHIIGVGGAGSTIIRSSGDSIPVFCLNPGETSPVRNLRISGLDISYALASSYPDNGPPSPGYKSAIEVGDSTSYVEIDHCIFPDSNGVGSYKTITVSDTDNRYFDIHHNLFYRDRMISIDAAFDASRIHDNFFVWTDTAGVEGTMMEAISLYTGAKHNVIYDNYFIDHNAAVSFVGSDSNLAAGNFTGIMAGEAYTGDAPSTGNIIAGNWGGNQSYFNVDAGNCARNTIEEELYNLWRARMMNPLPGSFLPNGHLQVSNDYPDSTDPAGWGTELGGVGGVNIWLSAENPFEGYARSMYFSAAEGIKTRTFTLDTGYYEMSAQIWHGVNTDSTKFICYVNCTDAVNWTNGNTEVWATGFTDWQGHIGIIHIDSLDEYCFAIQTHDTAYVAEVALRPFSTIGHTATASLSESESAKLDSVYRSVGWPGISHPIATLQMKLGAYSGAGGDNNNVKDDITAITTLGGGTEPETLYVFAIDTTALEGVAVTVRTIDQSSTRVPGRLTNSGGRLVLELSPDSFVVALYANNYTQGDLDTILVENGGGTDTLWMVQFDPGNPPSPDLCRVYGWVYDITGDSLKNVVVTVEIPSEYQPVKYSGVMITPFKESTETDSTGYWQIDLFPNSILSNPDSKYLFTIEFPSGIVYRSKVAVPDSISWQLQ